MAKTIIKYSSLTLTGIMLMLGTVYVGGYLVLESLRWMAVNPPW